MSRINTNISALIAQRNLQKSQSDLSVRLQRLSTGLRINRGADDPAGLIVSERLRNEIQAIGQAVDNAERASTVIATAESALQEVNSLLVSIKSLIVEASNTGAFSDDERDANQAQIDSAIESITRISNTTSFAGLKLLNGSLDYNLSGVTASAIADVKVFGANFGNREYVPVSVEVLNSAELGQLFVSAGGDTFPSVGGITSAIITIEGTRGVETFKVTSGMAVADVVEAINGLADATGVSAALVNSADAASGMVLMSTTYGSEAFVRVNSSESGFFKTYETQGAAGTATDNDEGVDVMALVNGTLALGDGLDVALRTSTLNLEMQLTAAFAQTTGSSKSFSITGGGALYQIGPSVNSQQQVGIGIQSVAANRLGNDVIGFLDSLKTGGDNALRTENFKEASDILDESIDQVSTLRGRLGAFEKNTLDTTIRSQQTALENLTSAESQIRDADFAEETSNLTRAQILTSAGTSVLAMANSSAQQVLNLLQ